MLWLRPESSGLSPLPADRLIWSESSIFRPSCFPVLLDPMRAFVASVLIFLSLPAAAQQRSAIFAREAILNGNGVDFSWPITFSGTIDAVSGNVSLGFPMGYVAATTANIPSPSQTPAAFAEALVNCWIASAQPTFSSDAPAFYAGPPPAGLGDFTGPQSNVSPNQPVTIFGAGSPVPGGLFSVILKSNPPASTASSFSSSGLSPPVTWRPAYRLVTPTSPVFLQETPEDVEMGTRRFSIRYRERLNPWRFLFATAWLGFGVVCLFGGGGGGAAPRRGAGPLTNSRKHRALGVGIGGTGPAAYCHPHSNIAIRPIGLVLRQTSAWRCDTIDFFCGDREGGRGGGGGGGVADKDNRRLCSFRFPLRLLPATNIIACSTRLRAIDGCSSINLFQRCLRLGG